MCRIVNRGHIYVIRLRVINKYNYVLENDTELLFFYRHRYDFSKNILNVIEYLAVIAI